MSPLHKTYMTFGLVVLALFEFWTAMHVFGAKGPKKFGRLALRVHRIGGYVFLVYWIWPMWVGLDLLRRLSEEGTGWQFHGPRFYHAFLGVVMFLLLLLKVSFIRFYGNFRLHARMLGIILTIGTLVIWAIAGLFWLYIIGSPVIER